MVRTLIEMETVWAVSLIESASVSGALTIRYRRNRADGPPTQLERWASRDGLCRDEF